MTGSLLKARSFVALFILLTASFSFAQSDKSLSHLRDVLSVAGLTPQAFDLMINEVQTRNYKKDTVAIVDFSLSSKLKRLFLINLKTLNYQSFYVAHGMKSGGEFAQYFSNESGSNKSSLGFAITLPHDGRFGPSFALQGLSRSNSNVQSRAILIHGAEFASENFQRKYGFFGRSVGCYSVSYTDIPVILKNLGTGGLLLAYQKDLWSTAQTNPENQTLANAQPPPAPTQWETQENSQGQLEGRKVGYYLKKYGN